MNISNTPNIKTTISIYLPLIKSEINQSNITPTHSSFSIKQKTILLVEDYPLVAETTTLSLEHISYNVLHAKDAMEGIFLLDKDINKIDLLLTGIVMPGNLNGIELARKSLEKYPNLSILLTSGYPDKISESKDQLDNQLQLLTKPFTREELVSAIEKAINN